MEKIVADVSLPRDLTRDFPELLKAFSYHFNAWKVHEDTIQTPLRLKLSILRCYDAMMEVRPLFPFQNNIIPIIIIMNAVPRRWL